MREQEAKAAQEESKGRLDFLGDDEPSFFNDPKKLIQTGVIVLVLIIAIYAVFPKVLGLEGSLHKIEDGNPWWIGAAIGFNFAAFAAYVALFRGVIGEQIIHLEWSESYQITMAGLAATRLFSAGGAGGLVLTYWALRKAGLERRRSACRMVAFLIVLYSVYLLALIVFGILLRTGVLSGKNSAGLTIVPAAISASLLVLLIATAKLPEGFERRIGAAKGRRAARLTRRLATVPATLAQATRTALSFVRHPSRGALAFVGAFGFWASNIGILWASFHAFGVAVPFGVLVQGFFIGMAANLFPLAPGGVGAVDAGMIGTFVLFGLPDSDVFTAVLSYRVIAFWLPIPPGIVAFFQLRKTVARWEAEGRPVPDTPEAASGAATAPA
ncbi:MAG: YbhN family protein [Solirubrobacterales bacterium]